MQTFAKPRALVSFYDTELNNVKEATEKAFGVWGCPQLMSQMHFEWSARFKSRGADAIYYTFKKSGRIRLSMDIWPHFSEVERYETAVHEAAHIAATYLYGGRQGHGHNWKRLMRRMGLKPTRCHNVDTFGLGISKRRTTTQTYYQCRCTAGVHVGPIVHKKIQGGKLGYKCRACRTPISRVTPFEVRA